MKNIFFLFCVLFCFSQYNAQIITVVDGTTLLPISNVTLVNIENNNEIGKTNQIGCVTINSIPSIIGFSHPDYSNYTISKKDLTNKGFKIYLNQNYNSINEIVISASKFEEKRKDVAQKIQVVSNSELKFQNQSSTADVMSNTGNVFVQKSQLGGGSPIIRGFETNKVLLVVDGIRMNNAIYRGGHLQNIITIDNSMLERAEIIFGPGSTVYGSDAIGGVMNFTTKNPTLSSMNKTLVKAGAYTRYFSAAKGYAAHADVSVGTNKFGSLTSFTFSSFGDLKQGSVRSPFVGNFGERPWSVERINGVDSIVTSSNKNVQVGSGYS